MIGSCKEQIAAHQQPSASLTRMPHIRKAGKGFDGMQLELNETGTAVIAVIAVIVFEDCDTRASVASFMLRPAMTLDLI